MTTSDALLPVIRQIVHAPGYSGDSWHQTLGVLSTQESPSSDLQTLLHLYNSSIIKFGSIYKEQH